MKPNKPTSKPTASKPTEPKPVDTVSLRSICDELKIEPTEARKILRAIDAKKFPELAKAHRPGKTW